VLFRVPRSEGGRASFPHPGHRTERQTVIRYVNAEDILPPSLVEEIRRYYPIGMLYIPRRAERLPWGQLSGSREELVRRNERIREDYHAGADVDSLARDYCLSPDSIRKIVKK